MNEEVENLTIWDDDTPQEVVDRIRLVLIELGVKIIEIGIGQDCRVYELTRSSRLV